jgi:hypothetical protein
MPLLFFQIEKRENYLMTNQRRLTSGGTLRKAVRACSCLPWKKYISPTEIVPVNCLGLTAMAFSNS